MPVRITTEIVQITNEGRERLTVSDGTFPDEVRIAVDDDIMLFMPKHEFAAFVDELHRRWGGFKQS